jgi:hypothetical protein
MKEEKKTICVCLCAPEAPQLVGDGDGVLAGGGVGVAKCEGTCKCSKHTRVLVF